MLSSGHVSCLTCTGRSRVTLTSLKLPAPRPSKCQSSKRSASRNYVSQLQRVTATSPAAEQTQLQDDFPHTDSKTGGTNPESTVTVPLVDFKGEESDDESGDDENWSDIEFQNPGMLSEEELLAQDRAFAQPVLTSEPESADHRAGYVAIVGRPNAGKSTLLNALLRQKLSAVTAKAQTTRHRILGIVSEDDYQLILLDTPGVIQSQVSSLDRKMMHNVNTAVQQADAILVIVDATSDLQEVLQMPGMAPGWRGPPAALVLNKADMLKPAALHAAGEWLRSRTAAAAILPASAMAKRGLEKVEAWAVQQLPLGPTLYPKDSVSEQSERFFVAEIVREQVFLQFRQEIPYSTAVLVTEFKERTPPQKDYVQVTLLVDSDTQRPIILGTNGSSIKKLSTASRIAIEEFLQRKIYLDITVKTERNWRKNEKLLDTIGY